MVHVLVEDAPLLRHAPPARTAAAAREVDVVHSIGVAFDPIIVDVIPRMLVWPERVLPIHPVEAYVGSVAGAVREATDVAWPVHSRAVDNLVQALVLLAEEVLLAQHAGEDVRVAAEGPAAVFLRV